MSARHDDPITLEIIRHALIAIPDLVDANITRTAYSPLIFEYKDYAVGIVDSSGELISQCRGGIPLFVTTALGDAVRDGIAIFGEEGIGPGDVIVTNYVGTQGQHLNNVVMYTPIFAEGSARPFAWFAVLVHWCDIGGLAEGSIDGAAREIFQEGLHLRSVRLVQGGRKIEDIWRIIALNTREPDMLLGDVEAQLAGCLLGRAQCEELIARYGAAAIRSAIETIWARSDEAARAVVRDIPDGIYEAESWLDGDGVDKNRKVRIHAKVEVRGDAMAVDLSGVEEQLPGPFNSGFTGGAMTAARIAFKYLTTPGEPANSGAFRALDVICPEGRFLNARHGAPMGLYSSPLPTVIDTIVRAIAPACPQRVAAGHFADFSLFRIYGPHPKTGKLYNMYGSGFGGWGALQDSDGPGPFKTMAHGDVLEVPAELHEATTPVRVESCEFLTDTGGAGASRGAPGLRKTFRVLADAKCFVVFGRVTSKPWGLEGGCEGATGQAVLHREGAEPRIMHKEWGVPLKPGDRIELQTGGGGGFGPPQARDPSRVAADVRQGLVSPDAAQALYRVALRGDGEVDQMATNALRKG